MSFIDSPPIRRLSASGTSQEELINAYEAEEERIVNVLSRKLEQLREDKIDLENVLEAESELAVNRLSRELGALRMQNPSGAASSSPADPNAEVLLDAMRRENEELRRRLVDTERDYIRISRLNEIYRVELIEHRNRVRYSKSTCTFGLITSPTARSSSRQSRRNVPNIPISSLQSLFTLDFSRCISPSSFIPSFKRRSNPTSFITDS